MSYLNAQPPEATLLHVFTAYPDTARPLLELHEELLRKPSPFTVAERELMAAYVSGLNDCGYCHGIHTATAEAFGVPEGLLAAALADLDAAPVDPRLKPVLRYLEILTRTPSRLTPQDAEAVRAAGWDDRALHDAVLVGALFNFMNRMVEGLGIAGDPAYAPSAADRLHRHGYTALTTANTGS
ncbi:carboxymuconolactone decarboxylase family protein [Streptomyces sp. 12297]|uniref:carboxymuconolactone decarboxylase family protein n=1 Tax=Streptomyces sp. NBC_00239 TaxID=2903640 RepID=UPI002E29ABF9|nr:carboxymuconolactone decarboxylase family protein [Streptomyces sp. NBC_00239]